MKILPFIGLILSISGPAFAGFNLAPKMTTEAPVENFFLPSFNESGHKNWSLRGKEGILGAQDRIEVKGMELQTFSGDENISPQTTIECPQATILFNESKAFSNHRVIMRGPSFDLVGEKWLWDGKLNKIFVKKNIRVTFEESIDNLLKQ